VHLRATQSGKNEIDRFKLYSVYRRSSQLISWPQMLMDAT
jgi:hypothetical protein